MGVMPCYRNDCRNILCDKMLNGNYICNECANDYQVYKQEWLNLNDKEELTKKDILDMIEKFFYTTKEETQKVNTENIDEIFRSLEDFYD